MITDILTYIGDLWHEYAHMRAPTFFLFVPLKIKVVERRLKLWSLDFHVSIYLFMC